MIVNLYLSLIILVYKSITFPVFHCTRIVRFNCLLLVVRNLLSVLFSLCINMPCNGMQHVCKAKLVSGHCVTVGYRMSLDVPSV